MSNLELKAILDISLIWITIIGVPSILAGLRINRYNRCKEIANKKEADLNVEKVNKQQRTAKVLKLSKKKYNINL